MATTTNTTHTASPLLHYGRMLDTKKSFDEFLGGLLTLVTKVGEPVVGGEWGLAYCDLLSLLSNLEKAVCDQEAYNLKLATESVETARMLVDTWAKRNVAVYPVQAKG